MRRAVVVRESSHASPVSQPDVIACAVKVAAMAVAKR
jgi:hypothetical protein